MHRINLSDQRCDEAIMKFDHMHDSITSSLTFCPVVQLSLAVHSCLNEGVGQDSSAVQTRSNLIYPLFTCP